MKAVETRTKYGVTSIPMDLNVHKQFKAYCQENGLKMSRMVSRILQEWLKSR